MLFRYLYCLVFFLMLSFTFCPHFIPLMQLAFESLAVISNALTRLEAGDLGVCRWVPFHVYGKLTKIVPNRHKGSGVINTSQTTICWFQPLQPFNNEHFSLSLALIGWLNYWFCIHCSFGETVRLLHPFHEPFTDQSGARILQQFTFDQKKTKIAQVSNGCSINCVRLRPSHTDPAIVPAEPQHVLLRLDYMAWKEVGQLIENYIM